MFGLRGSIITFQRLQITFAFTKMFIKIGTCHSVSSSWPFLSFSTKLRQGRKPFLTSHYPTPNQLSTPPLCSSTILFYFLLNFHVIKIIQLSIDSFPTILDHRGKYMICFVSVHLETSITFGNEKRLLDETKQAMGQFAS